MCSLDDHMFSVIRLRTYMNRMVSRLPMSVHIINVPLRCHRSSRTLFRQHADAIQSQRGKPSRRTHIEKAPGLASPCRSKSCTVGGHN